MATSMVTITLQWKRVSGRAGPGLEKELPVSAPFQLALPVPQQHRRLSSTQMENKNTKRHLKGKPTSTTSKSPYDPSLPLSFLYHPHYVCILLQSCWEVTLRAVFAATHQGGVSGIQNSLGKGKESTRPEDKARSKETGSHL